MAAVSVEEQLLYIKIEYSKGKSGKENHENSCEACGSNALSFKTVYRWLARFSAKKTDISYKACSGRPHEATETDLYHIEKVKEVFDEDRRLTYDEVAGSVGISHRSDYQIITRHLKMRRIAERWVPRFLTRDQMQERVRLQRNISIGMKMKAKHFQIAFWLKMRYGLRSYEPELKSHSQASPRPANFRRKKNKATSNVYSRQIIFPLEKLLIVNIIQTFGEKNCDQLCVRNAKRY